MNHNFVWKAHLDGTASWFFESDALTEWKKTGSFLWIHGKRMVFSLSARDNIETNSLPSGIGEKHTSVCSTSLVDVKIN
jgi:hypothetical protein